MLFLPPPQHVPCEHCGASIARGHEATHECDDERMLEFRLVQLRAEVDAFDDEFAAWLRTPRGCFELFYAERTRRG